MKISGQSEQINELIKQAKRVTLLTYYNPKMDVVNSALVWRNLLDRRDKEVSLIAPNWTPRSDEYSWVLTELPPKRTTIKVELGDERVKKISYELKDKNLFLYLIPEKGVIEGNKVEISTDQLKTDLVITFGIRKPEDLTDWPSSWPEDIKGYAPIINLDISNVNSQFGSINVVEPEYELFSHMVFDLIKSLEMECDSFSAELLLNGIKQATNNFSKNVSAKIFEMSAELMRIIEDGESKQ